MLLAIRESRGPRVRTTRGRFRKEAASGVSSDEKSCDGHAVARPAELFVLGNNEVLEAEFITLGVADRGEQLADQLMEMLFTNRVKVVLAVATWLNDAGDAEQGQVMADGRLALAQLVAQGADVQFAFAKQIHQNLQPRFVGQQLEDLDQVLFQLL